MLSELVTPEVLHNDCEEEISSIYNRTTLSVIVAANMSLEALQPRMEGLRLLLPDAECHGGDALGLVLHPAQDARRHHLALHVPDFQLVTGAPRPHRCTQFSAGRW